MDTLGGAQDTIAKAMSKRPTTTIATKPAAAAPAPY
jgi:hypothetical protein